MTTTTRTRRPSRTEAEWTRIARKEIVPALRGGEPIGSVYERYGGQNHIRQALARIGYDTRGRKIETQQLSASAPSRLAAKIARRRRERAPWWLLEIESGKSEDELRQLLARYGHDDVAEGRVLIGS